MTDWIGWTTDRQHRHIVTALGDTDLTGHAATAKCGATVTIDRRRDWSDSTGANLCWDCLAKGMNR